MQEIYNFQDYFTLDSSQLVNTVLICPECGREHVIPFRIVLSGENLINRIPEVIQTELGNKPCCVGVVYDRHIESRLESLFYKPFIDLGIPNVRIPLGKQGERLDASVEIGDKAVEQLPGEINFLVGVSSGVNSDLTKWIATRHNKPYMLMGTAASMNAFTSITATMTEIM